MPGSAVSPADLCRRLGCHPRRDPVRTPSLARGAEVYQANCAGCHGALGRATALWPGARPQAGRPDRRAVRWPTSPRSTTIAGSRSAWSARRCRRSSAALGRGPVGGGALCAAPRLPQRRRRGAVRGSSPLPRLAGCPTSSSQKALGAQNGGTATARPAPQRCGAFSLTPPPTAQRRYSTRCAPSWNRRYVLARTGDRPRHPRARCLHDLRAGRALASGPRTRSSPASSRRVRRAPRRAPRAEHRGAELDRHPRSQLAAGLENAPSAPWATRSRRANLFVQSFVILVREGLEAILIVGALMTFLVKMGAAHRKRDIHLGSRGGHRARACSRPSRSRRCSISARPTRRRSRAAR